MVKYLAKEKAKREKVLRFKIMKGNITKEESQEWQHLFVKELIAKGKLSGKEEG